MAVALVVTPVMVDRPKSAMQARRSLLTSMFAFAGSGYKYGKVSFGGNETHPFQISVYHPEIVHVLQPTCNPGQLSGRDQ